MIVFILAAVVMIAVPLILLGYNFSRSHSSVSDDVRRQNNIAAAKRRLAAADSKPTQDDTLLEYQDEVKAQLLTDTAASAMPPAAADTAVWRISGIALCTLLLLSALAIYGFYGTPQLIVPNAADTAHTGDDMHKMIAELERRAAENPNDGETLAMLGAAMVIAENYQQAAVYYAKARAIEGDTPRLMVAHIRALMLGGGDADTIAQELQTALALLPDNPFVLWLAAIHAQQTGNNDKALSYWYRMRDNTDDEEALHEANQAILQLEQTQSPAAFVEVNVQLADELRKQVSANHTVFIFAKTADGGGAPLAVWRTTAAALPLNITLNDSMAMLPQHTLSHHDSYQVIARISKSGDAAAASGDVFGTAAASRNSTITIVIDEQTP